MRGLTEDEIWLLGHISRWGSDGYPIQKVGSHHWAWGPVRSIQGPSVVFPTKRECTQSFEKFMEALREAKRELAKRSSYDDVCDLCMSSGVNVERTTYCGKTIGIGCGCDETSDGTCGQPNCEECKKGMASE